MATTATRPAADETTRTQSRRATAMEVVRDAAGAVKGATEDAAAKLPGIASTSRSVFDDANRLIAASSDEMVRFGTAVSFGFAVGLMAGGANRILVAAAFVPVCMMGLALLERSGPPHSVRAGAKAVGGLQAGSPLQAR
jgi:hypothetical protein